MTDEEMLRMIERRREDLRHRLRHEGTAMDDAPFFHLMGGLYALGQLLDELEKDRRP